MMVNPVLNQYSHEGATLTRAGRIARQAAAGGLHATETFASLAALEAIREFTFEYAGMTGALDGAGGARMFRIHFR